MTYEEADNLIREHIDYGGSLDIHALAVAIVSAMAGEPAAQSITLTGAQLLEAFQYVAPDHPNDPDQLEQELTIQYCIGHSGKGMYCWFTDYPDEGSMLLDGTTIASTEAAAGEPVAWRTTEPTVCVPMTEDSSVSAMWRDAGYDVIDLFEHRPSDDALWDQTLQARDNHHDWADKLANAIGLHLDVDIGEHSNTNNPWNEALDAIMAAPSVAEMTAASGQKLTDEQIIDVADKHGLITPDNGDVAFIEFARALLRASDSATASDKECKPAWHDDEGEMGELVIRCATCGTYKGAMCRLTGRDAS